MTQSARQFLIVALALLFSQPVTAEIITQWVSGGVVITYGYTGGVMTSINSSRKFSVTSGNGYIDISTSLDVTGSSTTTRMWVEEGIVYRMPLRVEIWGGRVLRTGSRCFRATFDSPTFSNSSTVSFYGFDKDNQKECPENMELSEVTDTIQLNASDGTYSNRVRVTWNEVEGATGYEVYRCTSSVPDDCGSPIALVDANGFNDWDGAIDTTYYYRVGVCEQDVCSEISDADSGFRSSSADDHGNQCSRATLIDANSTTPGNIEEGGDLDYFGIDLPEAGTLTLHTTGDTDTYGRLRDAACSDIVTNDNDGIGANFLISQKLAAGTYYVEVSNPLSSGTGHYELVSDFVSSRVFGDGFESE